MTSCHFIADRDFSLLCNINTYRLIHSRSQLIAVLTGKYLGVYDNTILAVRYLQRGITHLTCLFTEDRPQQALLCSQLSLSLRSNLSDQNVTGTYLSTDTDNSALVQILQCVIADTRNISCDLFRPELCITCLCLIFFNMNGCIDIVHNKLFTQENCVLVVVAFPRHESDQRVLTKCDLSI